MSKFGDIVWEVPEEHRARFAQEAVRYKHLKSIADDAAMRADAALQRLWDVVVELGYDPPQGRACFLEWETLQIVDKGPQRPGWGNITDHITALKRFTEEEGEP